MTEKDTGISWLKKHADTIVILSVFASAYWSLNEKMNESFSTISSDMNVRFSTTNEKMNERFSAISSDINTRFAITNEKIGNVEKELAIIKTVMVMKNIMPDELCKIPHEDKK